MDSILRTVLVASLGLLPSCGRMPTQSTDPAKDAKQLAVITEIQYCASVAGVKVDAIIFAEAMPNTDEWIAGVHYTGPANAYVECPKVGNENVIVWNGPYLEDPKTDMNYEKAVACHEVAHLFYHENEWPCVANEDRANQCGAMLQIGQKCPEPVPANLPLP